MLCPKCRSDQTQVIDSRDVDQRSIRRRRECEICHARFTTYERIEIARMTVIKRDGRVEPFGREKILNGIEIAANGRITPKLILEIVDEIESELAESSDGAVPTKKIGNMVIGKLKKIDEVSYLRYVSVYKNFQKISSFEQELTKLKGE